MEKELLQGISQRLGVLIALEMKAQSEHLSITEGVKMLARFGPWERRNRRDTRLVGQFGERNEKSPEETGRGVMETLLKRSLS